MKTLRIIFINATIAMFSIGLLSAQSNDYAILNSNEITVKAGHNAQFIAGVKQWKECYIENDGKNKWNMWRLEQGEGNVYVLTGMMAKWAEMDEENAAGKSCYLTYLNMIFPHIESQNSYTSTTMPDISADIPEETKYALVTYYEVHNEGDFENVINTVGNAIKKKEGDFRASWYNVQLAGPKAPDFFVASFYKKYAEMDIKRDSPSKIYTDLVGEEKAKEMWDIWFATLQNSWSFTYKLETELSY
jgi:hypothetical protein